MKSGTVTTFELVSPIGTNGLTPQSATMKLYLDDDSAKAALAVRLTAAEHDVIVPSEATSNMGSTHLSGMATETIRKLDHVRLVFNSGINIKQPTPNNQERWVQD